MPQARQYVHQRPQICSRQSYHFQYPPTVPHPPSTRQSTTTTRMGCLRRRRHTRAVPSDAQPTTRAPQQLYAIPPMRMRTPTVFDGGSGVYLRYQLIEIPGTSGGVVKFSTEQNDEGARNELIESSYVTHTPSQGHHAARVTRSHPGAYCASRQRHSIAQPPGRLTHDVDNQKMTPADNDQATESYPAHTSSSQSSPSLTIWRRMSSRLARE